MVRQRRLTWYLVLLLAAMATAFAAFLWVFQLPASAATRPPGHWLIQKQDLALIHASGATATFEWVMCYPSPAGQDLSCPVPTFTSYYAFARWARAGGHGTAEIDYESSVTPRWQMTHLMRYIRLAAQLGTARGVFTIFSPVTSAATVPTSMLAVDEQAARYGAGAVDIQRQWMVHHPWQYAALLRSWVPAIKAAGPGTLVLTGLSTAPSGHPATTWDLTETYQLTRGIPGLAGYWLITPIWPDGEGCAPQGCPQVAVEFLSRIGA